MVDLIAVDAMGGDNAPVEIIKGAIQGVNAHNASICLLGDERIINEQLGKYTFDKAKVAVRHTSEIVKGTDTPTDAIKNKKDSSMVVGLQMIKKGEAGAIVSAGNTGALMAGATVIVGRIKGIERPALGTLIPNINGVTFLIDSGANADVKPHYLTQFAMMGSAYVENILKVENPRVGLINVGSEKTKGSELYKECHRLLENSGVNFVGNIEGTDIAQGKTDILVCDGFVGNIVLKYSEGLSMALLTMIKKEITRTTKSRLAAAVLKPDFARLKKGFDASQYGGAPLLGLKGLVVKSHGGADALAIENAIRQCKLFMENKLNERIAEKLANVCSQEQSGTD